MCLCDLDGDKSLIGKDVIAYKVFELDKKGKPCPFYFKGNSNHFCVRKRYHKKDFEQIPVVIEGVYISGFHANINKKLTLIYNDHKLSYRYGIKIYKVKMHNVREVSSSGEVVADEMTLLERVK